MYPLFSYGMLGCLRVYNQITNVIEENIRVPPGRASYEMYYTYF